MHSDHCYCNRLTEFIICSLFP